LTLGSVGCASIVGVVVSAIVKLVGFKLVGFR